MTNEEIIQNRLTIAYFVAKSAIRVQRLACLRRPDVSDRIAAIMVALDECLAGDKATLAIQLEAELAGQTCELFNHCRGTRY